MKTSYQGRNEPSILRLNILFQPFPWQTPNAYEAGSLNFVWNVCVCVCIILKKVLQKSPPLLLLFLRHIYATPDEFCPFCLCLARSSSHRFSGIKTFPVLSFWSTIRSGILSDDWHITRLLAPFPSHTILLISATPGSLRARPSGRLTLHPSFPVSLTT